MEDSIGENVIVLMCFSYQFFEMADIQFNTVRGLMRLPALAVVTLVLLSNPYRNPCAFLICMFLFVWCRAALCSIMLRAKSARTLTLI